MRVPAYGGVAPLADLATVAVRDGGLRVGVHDPSLVGAVDKAIRGAGLGLNPAPAGGGGLTVRVPRASAATRAEMVKVRGPGGARGGGSGGGHVAGLGLPRVVCWPSAWEGGLLRGRGERWALPRRTERQRRPLGCALSGLGVTLETDTPCGPPRSVCCGGCALLPALCVSARAHVLAGPFWRWLARPRPVQTVARAGETARIAIRAARRPVHDAIRGLDDERRRKVLAKALERASEGALAAVAAAVAAKTADITAGG